MAPIIRPQPPGSRRGFAGNGAGQRVEKMRLSEIAHLVNRCSCVHHSFGDFTVSDCSPPWIHARKQSRGDAISSVAQYPHRIFLIQ